MNTELLTGLVGVGGAVLGGGVTGWVQLRQAKLQYSHERRTDWEKAQRQACTDLISALHSFQNACRELADELDKRPEDLGRCDSIYYDHFLAHWRSAWTADAVVRIHCPEPVTAAADAVWGPISELEAVTRNWYLALHDDRSNRRWDAFHTANSKVETPLKELAKAAQAALAASATSASR